MFNSRFSCNTGLRFYTKYDFTVYKDGFLYTPNVGTCSVMYSSLDFNQVIPLDIYTYSSGLVSTNRLNYTFGISGMSSFVTLCVPKSLKPESTSYFWCVNSWYEREVTEFFNVFFSGCDDGRGLLLPYSYFNVIGGSSFLDSGLYAIKYSTYSRCTSKKRRYDTVV